MRKVDADGRGGGPSPGAVLDVVTGGRRAAELRHASFMATSSPTTPTQLECVAEPE